MAKGSSAASAALIMHASEASNVNHNVLMFASILVVFVGSGRRRLVQRC
jgi:hypothetical protein